MKPRNIDILPDQHLADALADAGFVATIRDVRGNLTGHAVPLPEPTPAPTAHTPEPWSAHDRDVSGRTRDGYPTAIAECWDTAVSEDEDRANAARIVAAVNACAGIDDPGAALASIAGFLEDVARGCDPDEARTIAADLLALLGAP